MILKLIGSVDCFTHRDEQLLRSSNTLAQLHEGATEEIHSSISRTADAYHDASTLSTSSSSLAHHARFLRQLIAHDNNLRARQLEKERYQQQQSARASDTRYPCGSAELLVASCQTDGVFAQRLMLRATPQCSRPRPCTPRRRCRASPTTTLRTTTARPRGPPQPLLLCLAHPATPTKFVTNILLQTLLLLCAISATAMLLPATRPRFRNLLLLNRNRNCQLTHTPNRHTRRPTPTSCTSGTCTASSASRRPTATRTAP